MVTPEVAGSENVEARHAKCDLHHPRLVPSLFNPSTVLSPSDNLVFHALESRATACALELEIDDKRDHGHKEIKAKCVDYFIILASQDWQS
jgi:hypothetical protein